jgi:hypothetical protein
LQQQQHGGEQGEAPASSTDCNALHGWSLHREGKKKEKTNKHHTQTRLLTCIPLLQHNISGRCFSFPNPFPCSCLLPLPRHCWPDQSIHARL